MEILDLNYDEVKEQLLARLDIIINAIIDDKTIEIKKERNNIQVFEIKKKKLTKNLN